jgi:hypothetical protein
LVRAVSAFATDISPALFQQDLALLADERLGFRDDLLSIFPSIVVRNL